MKVEDIFADQTKLLNKMLKKIYPADAYILMKRILEIIFNKRLKKLDLRYHFDSEERINRKGWIQISNQNRVSSDREFE